MQPRAEQRMRVLLEVRAELAHCSLSRGCPERRVKYERELLRQKQQTSTAQDTNGGQDPSLVKVQLEGHL